VLRRALPLLLLLGLLGAPGWCGPASRPEPRQVREAVRVELAAGGYAGTPDQRALAQARMSIVQRVLRSVVTALEWLGKKLARPFMGAALTGGAGSYAVRMLLILVAVAVLGAALYVLFRHWRASREGRLRADVAINTGGGLRSIDDELLTLTARRALAIARRAASEGDFRRALRYCFMALLIRLSELGLYDLDPKRTNHEYERKLARESEERSLFSAGLSTFERKWYGLENVNRGEYEAYEQRLLVLIGEDGGRA